MSLAGMGCSPMSTLVLSRTGDFVALHPAALAHQSDSIAGRSVRQSGALAACPDKQITAVVLACRVYVSGYGSKAAKRGLGHGVSRERGRAQRGLDLYLRHIGTQDKSRS